MNRENKILEDKKAIEDKIIGERKRNDSFRRANDIRYKAFKDLKEYQKPLWFEIKIREEIQALDDEIEKQESTEQRGIN